MFLQVVKTLLNTLFMSVVVTPLLLLIVIPLSIYRLFINLLSKVFRRDLIEIVCLRDSVFANDKVATKPTSTIVISLFVPGNPDIKTIRDQVLLTFFGTDPKNPKYPVFLQYFENWGGFVFRKAETNFDINIHVKEWTKTNGSDNDQINLISSTKSEIDEIVTDHDFYLLRQKLLTEPYKPNTSPWEVILVRNYQETPEKPKDSILISKMHHGVVDGYSISKIWLKACHNIKDISKAIPQSVSKPLTLGQKLGTFSYAFTQTPSVAASQTPNVHLSNIFHPNNTKLVGKRHPVSTTISTNTVKEIAKETKTSYTSVIMEGMTGGIRNYLISKGKDLPASIDVTIPLPWPGHGDKVKNHFTFAVVEIPVGIPCHYQRLENIFRQLRNLKKSAVPSFNYVMGYLAGMLPNPLMIATLKAAPSSIIFSSVPGPPDQINVLGQPLLYHIFEGGYGHGDIGMGVSFTSYNGIVGIAINPEEGIIPTKSDAENLLCCIVNEFQLLHHDSNV